MLAARALLAIGAASMAALQAAPTHACSPLVTLEADSLSDEEIEALRAEALSRCAEAHSEKGDFLASVERGDRRNEEVWQFISRLTDGYSGCYADREMGFRIANAQFEDPLPIDISHYDLRRLIGLLNGNEELAGEARSRSMHAAEWLRSYRLSIPANWTEDEVEALLLEPRNWELSRLHLGGGGNNLTTALRLSLMFKHSTDPQSAFFDLQLASDLADQTTSLDDDLVVAHLLMRDGADDEALRQADHLLRWYSPYRLTGRPQFDEVVRAQYAYLGRQLVASDDQDLRAQGGAILNHLHAAATGEPLVPASPDVVELGDWEDLFPELNFSDPRIVARIGQNYPSRAIRREHTGVTGASLLFGPEGNFQEVWISQSSGSDFLDEAAQMVFNRYVRPRLADLVLPRELAGRPALVSIPPIVWRLLPVGEDGAFRDGRYYVTGTAINRTMGTC